MIEYDSLAEFRDPRTYDAICDAVDEELPLIEEWAGPPGGEVLDVACGTGRTALRLAARGYCVTGVDLVPVMIERGRQ
jgi:ubiquinone/menaquinone biosynthesis C-methylase UbiE